MFISTLYRRLGPLAFLLLWGLAGPALAQIPRSGYLQEGFEDGTFPPNGWQRLNVAGSQQWSRNTGKFRGGSASAFIQYQTSAAEDWLLMPRFRVVAGDSLTFWMRLAYQGYSPDELNIRLSATDSATASFTTELLRLQEGVNYPPNVTGWVRYAVSLNAYAGQKVYVAFRHTNNNGDGVYLDDITLGTKPAADVVVTGLTLPAALVVGRSYVPQASISNQGTQAQSFPVVLTAGAYSSTRTVTALAPGASITLSFDSWTPAATGTVVASVAAQLATDATPSNNQLSRSVAVYGTLATASGAKWRTGVALPAGRWAHGLAGSDKPATLSADPTVLYAVSGGNSSFGNEASVVRYDATTSSWTTRAAIPAARTQVAANWLNGKLYVAGGYSGSFAPTNRLDIYNPATDTWTAGATMPTAVGDYASAVYGDSLLYLIGGYNGSVDLTTVQVYNPRTNTWATGTAFAGTASAGLRGAIVGNKLVVAGGYNQSSGGSSQAWLGTIDPVTPTTITWSALPAYPGGNVSRLGVGALVSGQAARVYFAGGDPTGQGTSAATAAWAYDLSSSQWLVAPDLLEGVNNVSSLAPLVQQDSVYLVCAGGYNGAGVVSTVQRLNLGHRDNVIVGNDLVISNARTVAGGFYRSVTVTSTGDATVTAPLNAYGAVLVETGGKLRLNAPLTGSGAFELQNDATLAVQDAAGLSAGTTTGALRMSGSRSLAAGATYAYTGTTPQQTGTGLPATVRNLTIANPAGVTLSQAVAVERVVRCESGTLATDAASGRTLTLLSSASSTATALVAALGGSVGGDGGVLQRALDPGLNTAGEGYRHYSSPVSSLTVAALAQPGFAPVVNPAYNSAAQPSLTVPFPTLYTYDETRVAAGTPSFEAGYLSPAASSSTLPVGQGFSLHVPNWLRVDFKGTFNTGTLTLSGLSRGSTANAGWQLLGNPYPAPLDWSLVTAADRPGLDAALYVVQSTGAYTGQYRAYVNGIPVGNSPLIPAGQGFFVRTATAGTPGAITFRDAQRVTTWGAQPMFQRPTAVRPILQLTLRAAGSRTPLDEAHVYFEAGATAAFDPEFDAWQLPKTGPSLSLQAQGTTEPLSISGLPALLPGGPEQVVPLTITNAPAGALTLAISRSDFPTTVGLFIRDRLTGTLQDMIATPAYTLSTAPAPGQLELVLRPGAVTGTATAKAAPRLQVWPNPAQGSCRLSGPAGAEVSVLDALGRQVRTQKLNAAGLASLELSGLGAGVYVVRAGEQALRLVIE